MKSDPSNLPPSLQKFLTVTNEDGTPRTTAVPPSSLLSRLEAFLPEMESANKKLDSAACTGMDISRAQLRRERAKGQENDNTTENESGEESEEEGAEQETDGVATVSMDIYVDNSFGELVPSAEGEVADVANVEEKKSNKPSALVQLLQEDQVTNGTKKL